ncbi:MAG: hypothetical protein M1819_001128 [Sarea resinae]|nr:MAG: hypothetical protein M1819_001128 [Sarea resinae]
MAVEVLPSISTDRPVRSDQPLSAARPASPADPEKPTSSDSPTEPEAQRPNYGLRDTIPWWRMVTDQGVITNAVIDHQYAGSGTEEDPYVVHWLENDPRNPMLWKPWVKWTLTMLVAIATLAVAFVSSAYTGGIRQILVQFQVSEEVVTLGVSLFVLGFALGPLVWAPFSELYGRQILFTGTYACLTAFNAGAAGSQNMATLIILRFFAGSFGSSPLTNAGGVIADLFTAQERGLAACLFGAAPSLGPTIGPIVGGFLGQSKGWRWVEGLMAIFTGVVCIVCTLIVPETYAPVLLRKRAVRLSQMTGKVYRSKLDIEQGKTTVAEAYKTAIMRPWLLLIFEPIVLTMSIYMAIIYGTLYMMFAAFPIVYQEGRGWNEGVGGLAFLGIAVGMNLGIMWAVPDNQRYKRISRRYKGFAPPESRLRPAMIGGIALPIGLFWFAWSNSPSVFWFVPIAAGTPFGFGNVLVFLGIMNYLIDSYTIYAASVLAANSVLRSLFGAAFPLFTTYMYRNLGIHWAASIPAFLALGCVPFPFLFYKYGPAIRLRCKYAAQADKFMRTLQEKVEHAENERNEESPDSVPIQDKIHEEFPDDPYDIDRVHTRDSFPQPSIKPLERIRSHMSSKSGHA